VSSTGLGSGCAVRNRRRSSRRSQLLPPRCERNAMLRPSADHVGSKSSGGVAGQALRPFICNLERYRPPVRRLSTAPNSLMAKTMAAPALRRRMASWLAEANDRCSEMTRWARQGLTAGRSVLMCSARSWPNAPRRVGPTGRPTEPPSVGQLLAAPEGRPQRRQTARPECRTLG
jgi:hypothetical protein